LIIVVMGVSGCGKTTVGRMLGEALGWPFFDADDFHPEANVAKMRSGIPLTDDDRCPWLDRLVAEMGAIDHRGDHAVLGCSAVIYATPWETFPWHPSFPSPQAVTSGPSSVQVTGQMSPPLPLQR